MNGRGSSWPFSPDRRGRQRHRLLRDEVDAAAADRLDEARALLRRRGRLPSDDLPIDVQAADRRKRPARSPGRRAARRHRRARRARRATRSRHWAAPGRAPSRRGASAGRKPSMARASTTPEPSALAITTVPSRIACTRPGTPSRERGAQLQRIGEIGIEPAQQHLGALQAGTVRMNTPSSRTVRSSPSTSRKPR